MVTDINIPRDIMQSVILEVYRVAEILYLALGGEIPEGCKFSRSIDETAERCYEYAAAAYLNEIAACDTTPPPLV